ncbi:hypothetical protein CSB45_01025 [candidate division KSB3 bacterium]|uniref:Uncharacterized protein n=1 Tax=candidate division KSB3 bacterium TaxID=2044937 RepID=A0A2G6EAC3_9BACT|nr:MAG: hypothetical protein CSB45_01025 [candidate division KSB3 bacterium]
MPPHKIWFSSEGFAEALVMLQQQYRFDGILVNLPGRPETLLDDLESMTDTQEGELLCWKSGEPTLIPWDDNPQHRMADASDLLRADFTKIEADHLDCFDGLTGYTWGIYHTPFPPEKSLRGHLSDIPPSALFRPKWSRGNWNC